MLYRLPLFGLTSGTVPGTFKFLMGLKLANTAGHRARLVGLKGGGDGAPNDIQVKVKVAIYDNTTDGTSTDASGDVEQVDANSVATRMAAVRKNYTALPTTLVREVFADAFNDRGRLDKEFHDQDQMPRWGKNETLLVGVTIGSGSTAANLFLEVLWEED
ncbi:MAG: hypothetical protein GY778_19185 [bacterium]|nr:hypothetical protein [bacterium]